MSPGPPPGLTHNLGHVYARHPPNIFVPPPVLIPPSPRPPPSLSPPSDHFDPALCKILFFCFAARTTLFSFPPPLFITLVCPASRTSTYFVPCTLSTTV